MAFVSLLYNFDLVAPDATHGISPLKRSKYAAITSRGYADMRLVSFARVARAANQSIASDGFRLLFFCRVVVIDFKFFVNHGTPNERRSRGGGRRAGFSRFALFRPARVRRDWAGVRNRDNQPVNFRSTAIFPTRVSEYSMRRASNGDTDGSVTERLPEYRGRNLSRRIPRKETGVSGSDGDGDEGSGGEWISCYIRARLIIARLVSGSATTRRRCVTGRGISPPCHHGETWNAGFRRNVTGDAVRNDRGTGDLCE